MGLRAVAMVYIGKTEPIPDVDWEYSEYEVRDQYHKSNARCVLGIDRDRFHIVLKSTKTPYVPRVLSNFSTTSHRSSRSMSFDVRHGSMVSYGRTGSVIPHFLYVFHLPRSTTAMPSPLSPRSPRVPKRGMDRWLDARILWRQKDELRKQYQTEAKEEEFKERQRRQQFDSSVPQNVNLHREMLTLTPLISGDHDESHMEYDEQIGKRDTEELIGDTNSTPRVPPMISVETEGTRSSMWSMEAQEGREGPECQEGGTRGTTAKTVHNVHNVHNGNGVKLATKVTKPNLQSLAHHPVAGNYNVTNHPVNTVTPPPGKKRRRSSLWSFNFFGFKPLNRKKVEDDSNAINAVNSDMKAEENGDQKLKLDPKLSWSKSTESNGVNYNLWNTYSKDGRYFDDAKSPSNKKRANTVVSSNEGMSRKRRRSSGMSSIENDEFTPLTIELCHTISVLKRDNTGTV